MAQTFNFPIGPHYVTVEVRGTSAYTVAVDGNPFHTFKLSGISYMAGANDDFTFVLDGVTYIIAARRKSVRIATNGVYIDNGEPFIPAKPTPGWLWVFIILNLLIPIFTLGGLIPVLMALLGMYASTAIARSGLHTAAKLLLCLMATAAVFVITFFVVGGFSLLLGLL